jgi:cyclic pyranopterin phosphate synthase
MVDVSSKEESERTAVAEGFLHAAPETLRRIVEGNLPKGDFRPTVQLAGIAAAKRTSELIPLCHPLPLHHVEVEVETEESRLRIVATTTVTARTGVEMEALTAVSVALLTAYDMLKAVDKNMRIEDIRLLEKRGGRSGDWKADS